MNFVSILSYFLIFITASEARRTIITTFHGQVFTITGPTTLHWNTNYVQTHPQTFTEVYSTRDIATFTSSPAVPTQTVTTTVTKYDCECDPNVGKRDAQPTFNAMNNFNGSRVTSSVEPAQLVFKEDGDALIAETIPF